jgi:hypothetical protein
MFPFKTKSIFVNRWYAILWAVGILWFAYDVAESSKATAPEPVAGNAAAPEGSGDPIGDLNDQVTKIQQAN